MTLPFLEIILSRIHLRYFDSVNKGVVSDVNVKRKRKTWETKHNIPLYTQIENGYIYLFVCVFIFGKITCSIVHKGKWTRFLVMKTLWWMRSRRSQAHYHHCSHYFLHVCFSPSCDIHNRWKFVQTCTHFFFVLINITGVERGTVLSVCLSVDTWKLPHVDSSERRCSVYSSARATNELGL